MDLQIRLAHSSHSFALPVSGDAPWRHTSDGWEAHIKLPPIPKAHIIVPSFNTPSGDGHFQFLLADDATECALLPVPVEEESAKNAAKQPNKKNGSVTAHIDCWHSVRDVRNATLLLRVQSDVEPDEYLLCVSVRELELKHPPLPNREIALSAPAAISQMQADAKIRQRICSPTALAMALGFDADARWQRSVRACYDPATQAYGAWPLAIRFAGKCGHLGSVEASPNWDNAMAVLNAGMPVVCSIRFAKGELTGAPLTSTGGHLVCLYGVQRGKALVMDPAACDVSGVARSYDIREFTNAWLKHRGAAYFLAGS